MTFFELSNSVWRHLIQIWHMWPLLIPIIGVGLCVSWFYVVVEELVRVTFED